MFVLLQSFRLCLASHSSLTEPSSVPDKCLRSKLFCPSKSMAVFLFWLVDPHLSSSQSPAKRRRRPGWLHICWIVCRTLSMLQCRPHSRFICRTFFSFHMKMEIIKKECMARRGNCFCLTFKNNLVNLDKYIFCE